MKSGSCKWIAPALALVAISAINPSSSGASSGRACANDVVIQSLSDGAYALAWKAGGQESIRGLTLDPIGTPAASWGIRVDQADEARFDLVADKDGGFSLLWQDSSHRIRARRFDPVEGLPYAAPRVPKMSRRCAARLAQFLAGAGFDDDPAVELIDGDTYYVGQTLQRSLGVVPNESLDLFLSGIFTRRVFADGEGFVTFDTDAFDIGSWSLRDSDGNEIAAFGLVEMMLSISLDTSEVATSGPSSNATLETSSNRDPVIHYFTATLDEDAVDSATLARIFGGIGDVLDESTLRIQGGPASAFELNFSGVAGGDFLLTTNSPDTAAADSASLTVDPDLLFKDGFEQ